MPLLALAVLAMRQDAIANRLPTLMDAADRAVVFPVTPELKFANFWSEIARVTRYQTVRCFQWDSDWMVRSYGVMEAEARNSDLARDFMNCFSGEEGRRLLGRLLKGEALTRAEMGQNRWTQFGRTWKKMFSWDNVEGDDQVRLYMGTQPNLLIEVKGKYFQVVLRNCPDATRGLRQIFGRWQNADTNRCPPELLRDVKSTFAIPLDGKTHLTPLDALVAKLGMGSVRLLTVDARIKNLKIASYGRSGSLSTADLLRIVPETLDLYWRRVGEQWILAASPGDPFLEYRRRVTRRSNQDVADMAADLFGVTDASGLNEVEAWLNTPRKVSDLDNQQLYTLDALVKGCGSDENRQEWENLRSNLLQSGAILRFSFIFSPTLLRNGSQVGWTIQSSTPK